MKILVLSHSEVEQLLPMNECVEVMAEALAALAKGEMFLPLRMIVNPPAAAGMLGLMPAYRSGEDGAAAYGVKAVCVFPGNSAMGKDMHQGCVLLFSGETGEPLAVVNASAITSIRTGAVSAVATRLLARPDASDLAIVGAGTQGRAHLAAMACVRPLKRVRVADHNVERAKAFAKEMGARFSFPVEYVDSVQSAVRGADLIVTVTSSSEPVLKREWVSAGTHINAVGASFRNAREIDTATVAASRFFGDRRESTLNESGDYLFAAQDGAIGPDHIQGEIGEILIGTKEGRTSPDQITLFKALGLAVEDLAAAAHVYANAAHNGAGTWVEF
ncbi:MAG: ornithine cyclodeaminase family protein [Chloroflexi bacterium]|nr:ornithine cyclodeaminase family protein [Chloroflexota bacterium]